MKIKFSKMHGLGNDFVIINNLDLNYSFTSGQIQFLANRKFGVGCDQVLLVNKPDDGISDFYYKIYNADGSIAGQCGNGARCFVRYVTDNKLTLKREIQLQTRDRIVLGKVLDNNLIQVDMGVPDFTTSAIPLNANFAPNYSFNVNDKDIFFSALSMGNPHAVIRLDSAAKLDDSEALALIGSELQKSKLFPESVNVNFIYIESKEKIRLRTYERGCGFTLACGSGACASAAAAISEKLVNNIVEVEMPGGQLKIDWYGKNLNMIGEATHVFDGEINI